MDSTISTNRIARSVCVLTLVTLIVGPSSLAQRPETHTVKIDDIEFSVAAHLTIEKVAAEPLIKWPIVADWDSKGRLVVAESGGVGWPIQEHNQQKLHKIVRLVDEDNDGDFDRRIVAAKDLAFPEGVLCLGNEILVSAPPVIWKLIDDDDDGVCERREIWFDGSTVTNCANDLHGPYLGRDGWVYWCKGAFGKQTNDLTDGRTVTDSAAHIYRRRIDGGPVEQVISGGMDNPVEVAMTPSGDLFFTSTFLVHPGGGQRDGIGHAIYGAVFGKDHHVVDPLVKTGPLMGPMTHLGPAAPSGLMCVQSDRCRQHITQQTDSQVLLAALFNLNMLTAHTLVENGATFKTIDRELVVANRVDFHPTDVIECGDGSLLLIDTGGWYDLCCPTSRVNQKTAAGGIYRIRNRTRRGQSATAPSPVRKSTLLVENLRDPRPWIRREAELASRETSDPVFFREISKLAADDRQTVPDRQAAIWALCRQETPQADRVLLSLLDSEQDAVVQSALSALALHRQPEIRAHAEHLLANPSDAIKRRAAEAIGRIGRWESVPALLSAYEASGRDRSMQHALLYALIEIVRRNEHRAADWFGDERNASDSSHLEAKWIVAHQLNLADSIPVESLVNALEHGRQRTQITAAAILVASPEHAAFAADTLNQLYRRLSSNRSSVEPVLKALLVGWRDQPPVKNALHQWLEPSQERSTTQELFLARNLEQIIASPVERSTTETLCRWLEVASDDCRGRLLDGVARLRFDRQSREILSTTIESLAEKESVPNARLRWLGALPSGHPLEDDQLEFDSVTQFCSQDPQRVSLAARVIDRLHVSASASRQLNNSLGTVPPRFFSVAVSAIARSEDTASISAMLESLPSIPSAKTLPDGFLRQLFHDAHPDLRDRASQTDETLRRPPVDIQQKVASTLSQLPEGDAVRGLQVFRGSKASCSACHKMGYVGKSIGPDLTRIGRSRTREALLEAILFPSSRQEQSYQATRLLTSSGNVYNGLVLERNAESIRVQLAPDKSIRLATDEIEREQPSEISIMPSGLNEVLTDQELADLLALLLSAE